MPLTGDEKVRSPFWVLKNRKSASSARLLESQSSEGPGLLVGAYYFGVCMVQTADT